MITVLFFCREHDYVRSLNVSRSMRDTERIYLRINHFQMKHNREIQMTSLVVIDGDLISYKCAAANESRTVEVIHKSSGRSTEFDNRTAFRTWLKKEDKWEESEFDIHDVQSPQPLQ